MKALTALAVLSVLLLYVWERVDVVQVGYHIEPLPDIQEQDGQYRKSG